MTAARSLPERVKDAWASLDDRTTWHVLLLKGIAFEIAQHARNRLALGLVVFFIPFWLALVSSIIPGSRSTSTPGCCATRCGSTRTNWP